MRSVGLLKRNHRNLCISFIPYYLIINNRLSDFIVLIQVLYFESLNRNFEIDLGPDLELDNI